MLCSSRRLFLLVGLLGLPTGQSQELPPFKIVHLGDSASAGNGARDESGNRNYVGVRDCFRSPTSWGENFADSLRDVFRVTFINKACSGAKLSALLGPQEKDLEAKSLSGNCPTPDNTDEFYQDNGDLLGTACRRYIFPQINAIDKSVNLVLLTFGANDLGFASIVENCFALGARDVDGCREDIMAAADALADLQDTITEALVAISAKLNNDAKVVLVSYPYLLLDTTYTLTDIIGSDSIDVRDALYALQEEGDARQGNAVAAANLEVGRDFAIFYDGTKELFEGREPDPSVLSENEDRWIWEFDGLTPPEWYHFNAEGHAQLGEALSAFFSIVDAQPGAFDNGGSIDMAFVVDTTGSMSGEIADVRNNLATLVAELAAATSDFRVAVVSYKDFPEFCSGNYPARVDQDFTNQLSLIQAGIDSLVASGGCDGPETVYSGIKAALDLSWTSGATKIMIVIGDAEAKVVSGAEPISGLTASQLIAESIALDPVAVTGADVGSLDGGGFVSAISAATGGGIIAGGDVVATISEVIASASGSPFAWLGIAYSGKVGVPITFDASGSYDSEGVGIVLYEWSFFGDGDYSVQTIEPEAMFTYDTAFVGVVLLRVTSASGATALGSALITVNEDGFASQGEDEPCEVDDEGFSITVGEDGSALPCTPTNLPTEDKDGTEEIIDDTSTDPPKKPHICFPGVDEVQVEGAGITRMDALKIGDSVLTADGTYSKIYSFGHAAPNDMTEYLQILADTMTKPLEISSEHFLYVYDDQTNKKIVVPASEVKIGDALISKHEGRPVKVKSISKVTSLGQYTPLTATGNLVVNGVVASIYTALPSPYDKYLSPEEQKWIQHAAAQPIRLWCGLFGCENEEYNENGHSKPVQVGIATLNVLDQIQIGIAVLNYLAKLQSEFLLSAVLYLIVIPFALSFEKMATIAAVVLGYCVWKKWAVRAVKSV